MTYCDKKTLIDSLKIILDTNDVELIKLMIESVIERLEEIPIDSDTSNHITLK